MGKRENHEKQTFGSWLAAAPVCFQAPRTIPTTSLAVSFGVWCGGGLGKQRWKREEAFVWGLWVFLIRSHAQLQRTLWRWDPVCGVVEVWTSKDGRGSFCLRPVAMSFCLRAVVFFLFSLFREGFKWELNIVHVAGVYWLV